MKPPLVSMKCLQCGASLPPPDSDGVFHCSYCGQRLEPARVQPGPPMPSELVGYPVVGSGGGAAAVLIVAVVAAVGLFGVAGAVFFMRSSRSTSVSVSTPAYPGAPPAPAPTERVLWDEGGGEPIPVHLAGAEAFIGRVRFGGSVDQLFVNAFDSRTTQPRWRIGPLGSYSTAYQATHCAVLADHVVVSSAKNTLLIHDLATGTKQREVPLTDRVDQMCAPRAGTQVWIEQIDKKKFFADVTTGALKEAGARPADCRILDYFARRTNLATDAELALVPKVSGFETRHVHIDGDLGVAGGVKSPGTETPLAVGFDPKTRAVRWQVTVPAVDLLTVRAERFMPEGMGGGRFVIAYGVGSDRFHMASFDARSGTKQWDVELKKIFAADILYDLVVGPSYLYVGRTSSLEIYEASSGKQAGAVGNDE